MGKWIALSLFAWMPCAGLGTAIDQRIGTDSWQIILAAVGFLAPLVYGAWRGYQKDRSDFMEAHGLSDADRDRRLSDNEYH